jgi:hypothetical protein
MMSLTLQQWGFNWLSLKSPTTITTSALQFKDSSIEYWLYEKGNYDDLRRDLQYVQWDTFNICLIFLIYLKLLDPTVLVSAFLRKERPF